MGSDYSTIMRKNQSKYVEYMQLAEQAYQNNGEKYCKEQGIYLQQAAMCQSEMANASEGAEKAYHEEKLRELTILIKKIARTLNPELVEKQLAKKRGDSSVDYNKNNVSPIRNNDSENPNEKWIQPKPKHSFEQVAGMDVLKRQLKECINDKESDEIRKYLNMDSIHSYFFIGPPGCGKTYIIEAFAHEVMGEDWKFLKASGSDIFSKFWGEAETNVKELFDTAIAFAPCVVFIDEIDGVCKNRSIPNLPDHAASLTTAFLEAYNKINSSGKEIIFLGASNYPDKVDSAMLDRVELIYVPLPDEKTRKFSLQSQLQGDKNMLSLSEDISWEYMTEMTEGYNQRDIKRLVNRVKALVLRRVKAKYNNQKEAVKAMSCGDFFLTKDIFDVAISECHPSPKTAILEELQAWKEKFESGSFED